MLDGTSNRGCWCEHLALYVVPFDQKTAEPLLLLYQYIVLSPMCKVTLGSPFKARYIISVIMIITITIIIVIIIIVIPPALFCS